MALISPIPIPIPFKRKAIALCMKKFRPPQMFFKDILNGMLTFAGVLTPDGEVLFANDTALKIAGIKLCDVQGKMFHDTFWFQHADESRRIIKNAVENCRAGKLVKLEIKTQTVDSSLMWIEYSIHPIFDPYGKVQYLVPEGRDITPRKTAEKANVASETRYREMVEALPMAVFESDKKGYITFANQSGLELFGYSTEDFAQGLPVLDLIAPEERQKSLNHFDRILNCKNAYPDKYLAKRKDGTLFPVLYHASILLKNNKPAGTRGFAVDITDKEKKQKELLILSKCLEQAGEGVVITDSNANITYVNPAFEKITGYSKDEVIGQNPRLLQSKKHDPFFYKAMWDTLKNGDTWSGHFFNKKKDGTLYEEDATISPIFDDNTGSIINYIAAKKDVTGENEIKAMLWQAQRLETVGTLAGGIAHDFNNLLYIISGNTELLKDQARPEDKELLQEIHSATQKGTDLVKKILTFSRKAEYNLQPTHLNVVVEQTLSMLERLIPRTLEITLDLAEDVYTVNADPGSIEQVLTNLAVNARDAMPDGGKLVIKTENGLIDEAFQEKYLKAINLTAVKGRCIILSVSDTGQGMDDNTREHIFDPFFTKGKAQKGTGLGLSIVYGIVKAHNGFIFCDSEINKGTTFKIYLPACDGSELYPKKEKDISTALYGKETILIVDDEKSILKVMTAMLNQLGYETVSTDSGTSALNIYSEKNNEIDLILLDLNMPGMDGWRCLKELHKINADAKIIILSGYAEKGLIKDTLDKGAKAAIVKPVAMADLSKTIRKVLDEG
ncbi:MAG: PAS domain S-box protein [Desulfosalsimonadaceae bacterium]